MLNIPIPNQFIFEKNIETKNNTNKFSNKSFDKYEICREYEIKNFYFDKNGNNITKDKNKWNDHLVNKSIVQFVWDNKTNIFGFYFSFLEKNFIKEISIKINDEKTQNIKLNFLYEDKMYKLFITSAEILNNAFNMSKPMSLQLMIKCNDITKYINIIIGNYQNKKNDFMIQKNSDLSLDFQNSISIKGEEIKNTFSSLKFSPCEIYQGVWNKDIMKIEESNSDLFVRNHVSNSIIENLPVSSGSKGSFETKIDDIENSSYIRIYQNTYYDLKKKETIKGFGENSNSGYIPPFEFTGLFFPILQLKINGLDIKISWEQKFEKPYFKNNEGINKIYLDNSYNYDQQLEWTEINAELIKESKKYNFTFAEFLDWLNK